MSVQSTSGQVRQSQGSKKPSPFFRNPKWAFVTALFLTIGLSLVVAGVIRDKCFEATDFNKDVVANLYGSGITLAVIGGVSLIMYKSTKKDERST